MTTAREFYKESYDNLGLADRVRLDELAAISTRLAETTVVGMQNNVRVRLSHFNFFFPYFFKLKPVGDEYVRDEDALRNMWSACCGSLQHDVDVIEDPNFDNPAAPIVFTFPSYWDSSFLNTNPSQLSGESYDSMRRRMESERNFPDQAVNTYLKNTHARIAEQISPQISNASNERRRNLYAKILAYYNVPAGATQGQGNVGAAAQQLQGLNASPKPFGDFGSF